MSLCRFNIDSPNNAHEQGAPGTVAIVGWFFDAEGKPAKGISVSDGIRILTCAPVDRPDVIEFHKRDRLVTGQVGFSANYESAPGTYELEINAETVAGEIIQISRVSITVPPPSPQSGIAGDAWTEEPAPLPEIPVPRLPGGAGVVVSVLFYYREDLVFRSLDALIPQLLHTSHATGVRVSLVCVLNYPAPPDLKNRINTYLARGQATSGELQVIIDEPGYNLGFGAGHNRVFRRHDSELFVMVNSDVRMEQLDWLARIVTLFAQEPHACAGLAATAARLRSDGCGIDVPNPKQDGFDFVDGSLLAVNSATARFLGLFAESYRYFYFEDADLCLRYRQAGLMPALLDLAYHHDRFSSTRLMPRRVIEGVLDHNRARFFESWGPFLARRTLSRRLLVQFDPFNCNQQCAALPGLFGLLADHPSAVIDLVGVHPSLRTLFRHPQFAIRTESFPDPESRHYHRSYRLARPEPELQPLVLAICAQMQTEADFESTCRHLGALADSSTVPKIAVTTIVVVPADTPYFCGLRPEVAVFEKIIETRRRSGPVSIYTELPRYQWPSGWNPLQINGDSILTLLGELRGQPLVITTDHWILQLAQMMGARCFAWFGATAPRTRIHDWSRCGAFTAPDVTCIGCSQTLGCAHENACVRADVACINHKWSVLFLKELEAFTRQTEAPAWLKHAWTIPELTTRRQPSVEMDLSRWNPTTAGQVLVLIPVKPGLPGASLQLCRSLAERAIRNLPNSRIVLDDTAASAPPRGAHPYRQSALAEIRQGMIDRHLRDEKWVFWVDADIVDYSENLIIDLIHRADGGIAAPLVIMEGRLGDPLTNSHGFGPGRFFDVAGFVEEGRWAAFAKPYFRQPGPIFNLESVGSCYLVNADLYRHGACHEADPLSKNFVASQQAWPDDALKHGQAGHPLAYTEHYSVCTFARKEGLPVRAFSDLIVYHEQVG